MLPKGHISLVGYHLAQLQVGGASALSHAITRVLITTPKINLILIGYRAMARHRGTYKPDREEPYDLSRGRLKALITCEACFWLDRARGVKFPYIPGFLLNTNTDTLLKKDFDQFRGKGPHPVMSAAGLSYLRPFAHEDIENWESSSQFGSSPSHFNTIHEETNILFGEVLMMCGKILNLENCI